MNSKVTSHIAIIVDINSIPKLSFPNHGSTQNNENTPSIDCPGPSNISSEEPFSDPMSSPYNLEVAKWIKEKVIALLCKEAIDLTPTRQFSKFNFSKVLWSFKIYNSSLELNSKTGRAFLPLSIGSIELFEKHLDDYLDPSCQSAIKSLPHLNGINLLSTAMKSVLSDLRWPEETKDFGISANERDCGRNIIYALIRVPRNENELKDFMTNWTPSYGSKELMEQLLPKAFSTKMKQEQIQLNLIDLWPLHENCGMSLETEKWDGVTYYRPILRVVHFLSQGFITPLTKMCEGIPQGLPSYGSLLKIFISSGGADPIKEESNKTAPEENKVSLAKLNTPASSHGKIIKKISPVSSIPSAFRSIENGNRSVQSMSRMSQSQHDKISKDERHRHLSKAMTGRERSIQRYSDERSRLNTSRDSQREELILSRKRKLAYEEERFQTGYSKKEIHNWCMEGKVGGEQIERKPTPAELERYMRKVRNDRRNTIASSSQVYLRERERNMNKMYDEISNSTRSRYPPSVSPGLNLRPHKRSRRDELEIMQPPSRKAIIKQQRHSAPVAFESNQRQSTPGMVVGSRGRFMVAEGLKKITKTKTDHHYESGFPEVDNRMKEKKDKYIQQRSKEVESLKNRFILKLSEHKTTEEIISNDPTEYLISKVNLFKEVCVAEGRCLVSLAQVLVNVLGRHLREMNVRDIKASLERILLVPFEDMNLMILRSAKSEIADISFRQCELQVLLNMEFFWSVYGGTVEDTADDIVDDIIKILNMIKAYRRQPPIEEFVNEVLVTEYVKTHKQLLKEILIALHITPPESMEHLLNSPVIDDQEFRDDDSSVSSAHSSLCEPGDSCSQHPLDNHSLKLMHYNSRVSQEPRERSISQDSQRNFHKNTSFLQGNNPKHAIMIQSAKVQETKPRGELRSRMTGSAQSGIVRQSPKPKKVRRNLFDVTAKDSKDTKHLLSLAMSSNAFARSPSLFKSPSSKKSYSPRSPARVSPFFRAARSRRRLTMDEADLVESSVEISRIWDSSNNNSPGLMRDDVLVPESPCTPKSKGRISNPGSAGTSGKSVIQESPEIDKSGVGSSRPMTRRVDSVSFYSSGAESSLKSKAWERSGAKLVAARIKDSVDLSLALSLNDLEFLNDSPNSKANDTLRDHESRLELHDEENVKYSFKDKYEKNFSPVPCSSKKHGLGGHFEVVHAKPGELNSSNIKALIDSENFPLASSDIFNGQTCHSPSSPYHLTLLDTPSKRVQFNLHENLINTPSPKSNINGTPKSILKDAVGTAEHVLENLV